MVLECRISSKCIKIDHDDCTSKCLCEDVSCEFEHLRPLKVELNWRRALLTILDHLHSHTVHPSNNIRHRKYSGLYFYVKNHVKSIYFSSCKNIMGAYVSEN